MTTWCVDIFEYENCWGSRLDETLIFNNYHDAKQFQTDFNAENDSDVVPDWYMVAGEPYADHD